MRALPLFLAGCALLARHAASALSVISTLEDIAAIERSSQIHVLLLVASKTDDEAGEVAEMDVTPEQFAEMAANAYPALPALEEELEGVATFALADMSPKKAAKLKHKWNIASLPALVMYKDPPRENPYTGKLYRDTFVAEVSMLEHPRKLKRLIKDSVPTEFVEDLAVDSAAAFEAYTDEHTRGGDAVVVLISKQSQPSHLYRALATEFRQRGLKFAFLSSSSSASSDITTLLQVEKLPSLVVIKSKSERFALDNREDMKKYADLKRFIEPFARSSQKEPRSASGGTKASMATSILFLQESDFNKEVLESDVSWIISFVDAQQEAALDEKSWTKTFSELQKKGGIVGLAAVRCESEPALCERFGGPGIRLFPVEATESFRLKRSEVLPQMFASIDEAKEFALAFVPDVTVPVGSSIELQAFVSRSMDTNTLPVLFFTSKKVTPPMIKSLALSFPSQKLSVAVLRDADDQLKTQFTIRPSESASLMCLVPALEDPDADKSASPETAPQFAIAKYDKKLMGPFTYHNVMRYMMNVLAEYPHPREDRESGDVDVDLASESSAASLVPYLTKEKLGQLCDGNKICAIAFFEEHVDTLADQDSPLNKSWSVFARVAALSKQHREPFHFMWVNGKCQSEFADAFGIGHFQMPTVAVYSPSKQRFATNVGLFDEENVGSFLQSVLSGKIGTAPIDRVPVLTDECSFEELQDDSNAEDLTADEDDESLDDLLSEIITEEQKNRDLLEEELEAEHKAGKKNKKASKKSKKKTKSKKKKSERDEL